MSQQIQDKLDALAGAITDELSDAEKQRLDAVKAASDAAVETNRLRDDLSAQQAALAASVAEVTKLRKQLEAGGSGIPLWKNGAKLSDSRAWILPDGLNDNLIVDAPVELYCGVDMWPKNPGRPVLTLRADDWTLRGVPNRLTFNAPVGMPIKDGRYNFAECIRVGDNAGLTGKPVRNGRVIDISGGRVDALAKCYPDADGILFDRPASTADLLADGIYIGGAKNILIRMPDLTARYENTIRATSDHGVMPSGIAVVGGSVRNIGNKAALNPRHVNGFVAFGVRLFATGENSAVGVGNGDSANPGNPIGVSDHRLHRRGGRIDAPSSSRRRTAPQPIPLAGHSREQCHRRHREQRRQRDHHRQRRGKPDAAEGDGGVRRGPQQNQEPVGGTDDAQTIQTTAARDGRSGGLSSLRRDHRRG
jgi:hypothetical protein